jgi:hypothetical protein
MENKVPYLPITLSEFRIIQLAKQGLPKLLLSLIFLLVLNSCSKDATLDEVSPSSVETTKVLKEWAMKNDRLNQANLIEWNNSTPISLSDSIKGYSAPVKTASGYKEFITFELGGKRHGWYKSYNLLNSTDMQIVIQTSEGRTLRSGYIRKKSSTAPKGKSKSIREMNLEEDEEIVYDTWLDWVTISAPRLNSGGGGGFYFGNTRFDMNIFNYYMQAGLYNAGYYGGGANSIFAFKNQVEIKNNLTNSCFIQVFNDLQSMNVEGVISTILYDFGQLNSGCDFTIENKNIPPVINENGSVKYQFGTTDKQNIVLNDSSMKQASEEFIAAVIMHEMLHVYINSNKEVDHYQIADRYVKPIAELLQRKYGIKNEKEALAIAVTGLRTSSNYYLILADLKLQEEDVTNYFNAHLNLNLKKENGTYCQ